MKLIGRKPADDFSAGGVGTRGNACSQYGEVPAPDARNKIHSFHQTFPGSNDRSRLQEILPRTGASGKISTGFAGNDERIVRKMWITKFKTGKVRTE